MAKKDEKTTNAATLADETRQQPEITGGQQLAETGNSVPILPATEAPANPLAVSAAPLTVSAVNAGVSAALNFDEETVVTPASSVTALAASVERWTVQAVAVPNNRRMRGGQVFTDVPTTVCRDQFSDDEWRAIIQDKHIKAIRLDD